jgi:hypothetical protein
MAFKPKFKSGNHTERTPIESGQYDVRCFGVAELGSREKFNNFKKENEIVNEMMLFFEIPELQITWQKDGVEVTTPRALYPRFKVSMHEKAKLRQFIEAWFGKKFPDDESAENFDFTKVIGHCAQVSVELNEKGYSNIITISPLHKSVKLDKQFNEAVNFGIEDIDSPEFDKLFPWVQKIVKESIEYQERPEASTDELEGEEASDIPF